MPPPTRSAASCTTTSRPARARVIAAARPFGPEPTTIALPDAKSLTDARDAEAEPPLLRGGAVVGRVRRQDQVGRDGCQRRRLLRQHIERRAAEPARPQSDEYGA